MLLNVFSKFSICGRENMRSQEACRMKRYFAFILLSAALLLSGCAAKRSDAIEVETITPTPVYELDEAELLRELKLAKTLGMETVIIDDGWQTDDNSRGYA